MTASAEASRLREERARKALALREKGVPRDEIARRLGVSPYTVGGYFRDPDGSKGRKYRDGHTGTCRHCGSDTSRPANERCPRCVPREGPPWIWTREAIVEAIRAWVLTYGEPPSSRDWAPSSIDGERLARYRRLRAGARKNSRRGLIPTTVTVYTHFGSWNDAIEAAGFTPRVAGGQRVADDRTQCSKGHALDAENTLISKGRRRCRRCQLEHQENYRIRKRAKERGLILG